MPARMSVNVRGHFGGAFWFLPGPLDSRNVSDQEPWLQHNVLANLTNR